MSRLITTAIAFTVAVLAMMAEGRRSITEHDVGLILTTLDKALQSRDIVIDRRQRDIDSLTEVMNSGALSADIFREAGMKAKGFDNKLAINIYDRAVMYADSIGDRRSVAEFNLHKASLLPLAGFTAEAVELFARVDTSGLDLGIKRLYYDSGRKMYGYIATIYQEYPLVNEHYDSLSLEMMRTAVDLNRLSPLPPAPLRLVSEGEYLYLTGRHHEARRILLEVIDSVPVTDNAYAIAAYQLASIAEDLGNENELIYYLGLSALADNNAATREVTSLQKLGKYMLARDDVDRAHSYLSKAMQNATEAHAATRMIQTALALPLIEQVHNRELDASRKRIYILIGIMALLIVLLAGALVIARHRSVYRRKLHEHLEASNLVKEMYISRFLDLSAIYMDKLNQFCKVASNKIQTGQVDELYRLTRSGKFVENNSSDFYAIFDDAFLHMYPDFIEKVNLLLREDARITLREGEKMNTDLRILAFMRLGIDDTARVGRILNYSVNTIYAYRNKLRNRAIDRDNFEANIASI